MGFYAIIYSLFSGLAFSFALPPKALPGLEWIAFIPFLGILLFNLKTKRDYFILGFLSGLVAMGRYLFWFLNSAPLDWVGIFSFFWSAAIVGFIWLLTIAYFAFWFGLFILFIKYFKSGKILDVFLISLSWPVFELLRTFFYSFYPPVIGKGNIIGSHMALGIFGYSLADYPSLRQWAAIGGDYFLSFILVLVNAAIFYLLNLSVKNKKLIAENSKLFLKRYYPSLFSVLLIIAVALIIFIGGGRYLVGKYITPSAKINTAAVQLNFPSEVWSSFNYPQTVFSEIKGMLDGIFSQKPLVDLIVTPEGADFTRFSGISLKNIQGLLGSERYRVIIDGSYGGAGRDKNNLAVFDNSQGFLGTYAKRFLMPLGEYLPAAIEYPILVLFPHWMADFGYRWYLPGSQSGIFQVEFGKIGALACSEIISPELIREEANLGAQIIAYSVSDSIFRGSEELQAQNLAMAQIRAAETRRSIVYASNGERSFIIGPSGDILWLAGKLDSQSGYADAPLNSDLTPYDRFGDWFVYFSALILVLWQLLKSLAEKWKTRYRRHLN